MTLASRRPGRIHRSSAALLTLIAATGCWDTGRPPTVPSIPVTATPRATPPPPPATAGSSTTAPQDSGAPATPATTGTPAGVDRFEATFSGQTANGSIKDEALSGACVVVKSTVSTSWTLQLIGDSHDLRWYMEVGTFSNHYRGPGTYSSDAGDVKGHLDANDRTRNYWGGGALRGGSLTVGPDERSGSFDVTLRAGVNSRLEPSNTVRMTGSFSCSDLRAF